MHSSLAQVSLSQGRPAFIVLSFVCIFVWRSTCELWCSSCDVQGKREVTHQTVAVSRPYPWTQERLDANSVKWIRLFLNIRCEN